MGTSSETTTHNAEPYEPAQPMINQGLADARALYNNGGFHIDPYSGQMVAARNSAQSNALNAAQGALNMAQDNVQSLGNFYTGQMDGTVLDSMKQNVIEGIMPSINASFSHSGMAGSDLHQQNLAKGLASGLSGLESEAQGRAMSAAGALAGLPGTMQPQINALNTLGSQAQQHGQNQINADILQHQQGQTAEMDALRDYLSLVSGVGSTFGVQSSTTSGGGMGPMGILGAGLQAIPAIPALAAMSDRRVKKDIKHVGQTTDGLPWYEFKYVWDEVDAPIRQGVMADEVAQVKSEAIVMHPSGYAMVDYGLIGEMA